MIPTVFPPPISIKNVLGIRAVCSVVMDKVVYEVADSTTVTTLMSYTNPTDILYFIFAAYFIQMYISDHTPRRARETELRQLVLSDNVYRSVNVILFVLFLLIKNPLNAI
jgi:hypothetical protein